MNSNIKYISQVVTNAISINQGFGELKAALTKRFESAEKLSEEERGHVRAACEKSEFFKISLIFHIHEEQIYKEYGVSFHAFCNQLVGVSKSEAYKYVNRAKVELEVLGVGFVGQITNNDFLDHLHAIKKAFDEETMKQVFTAYQNKESVFSVDKLIKLLVSEYPSLFSALAQNSKKLRAFYENEEDNETGLLTEEMDKIDREEWEQLVSVKPKSRNKSKDALISFEEFDGSSFPDAISPDEVRKRIKPKDVWLNVLHAQLTTSDRNTEAALTTLVDEFDSETLSKTVTYLEQVLKALREKIHSTVRHDDDGFDYED